MKIDIPGIPGESAADGADFIALANWYETADWHVGETYVPTGTPGDVPVRVSTVLLPFDHGYEGSSLWYETMIFGGPRHEAMWRYRTREEAVEGHNRACDMCLTPADNDDV